MIIINQLIHLFINTEDGRIYLGEGGGFPPLSPGSLLLTFAAFGFGSLLFWLGSYQCPLPNVLNALKARDGKQASTYTQFHIDVFVERIKNPEFRRPQPELFFIDFFHKKRLKNIRVFCCIPS